MPYSALYGDTGDLLGTHDSVERAIEVLGELIRQRPSLQDSVGLRPYRDGHPSGVFESAGDVLGEDGLAQPHLF